MKEEIIKYHHLPPPQEVNICISQKDYSDVAKETRNSEELMSYSLENETIEK